MGLEDLIVRLRIDEDNWNKENKSNKMVAKVNIVESSNKGHKKKFDGQQQQNKNQKKFKSYCYNCGKPNHMSKM